MNNLYHNIARYVESHQQFQRLSDEHQAVATWCQSEIADVVATPPLAGDPLRVLGVGSGSGEKDVPILTALLKKHSRIFNCVVEPSHEHIGKYKALAKQCGDQLEMVEFDWREETIEKYSQSSATTNAQFDLIHVIHALFHVDDPEATIVNLYSTLLKPGGTLVIVHISSTGGWEKVWDKFGKHVQKSGRYNYITMEEIEQILDKHDIKHESRQLPSYFDITDCFHGNSEEGELVLDFLTQVDHFAASAPDDLKQELLDYLKTEECSYTQDNRTMFKSDMQVYIIKKE